MTDYGKLPPQAIDIERGLLGAVINYPEILVMVSDLKEDSFYKEAHQIIWNAILELYSEGIKTEILAVVNKLKKKNQLETIGGAYELVNLINLCCRPDQVEYFAVILKQQQIKRDIIRHSSELIKKSFDETTDSFDLLAELQSAGDVIAKSIITKRAITALEAHQNTIKYYQDKTIILGVNSGLKDLDALTNGFQPTDFIVLAGRPGMGKTSAILSMGTNAASIFKKGVAMFSLEMSTRQLVIKQQSMLSGIPLWKLRKKELTERDWQDLNKAIGPIVDSTFLFDDASRPTITALRAKCHQLKSKHDIGLIIIDYLQLIDGTEGNKKMSREQEISNISRSLKAMAKDLEIPVIALSQLSRDVEKRGGSKKPNLSDLRDSGAIEQDADMVIFVYRPEYYGIKEYEDGKSTEGVAELLIAKHRNGETKDVKVRFDSQTTGFYNLPDDYEFVKSTILKKSIFDDAF